MHFYPAGDFTALADCEWNLFFGVRWLHNTPDAACFDWAITAVNVRVIRSIAERHWMLRNLTLEDLRPYIVQSLDSLEYVCRQLDIEWHEPKQPGDLHELLCGLKVRREREDSLVSNGARTMGEIWAEP
jgi:hypothetical protein